MSLDFQGGSAPRSPYQLERDIEDAMESFNADYESQHTVRGAHTDVTVDSLASNTTGTPIRIEEGLRLLMGPWLIEEDGNASPTTGAVLAPPALTANVNNANWNGLATALIVELTATAARDITGITITGRVRRLLGFVNRSSYTLTFKHNSGSSTAKHRIAVAGGADYGLVSGGVLFWGYYDVGSEIWRFPAP